MPPMPAGWWDRRWAQGYTPSAEARQYTQPGRAVESELVETTGLRRDKHPQERGAPLRQAEGTQSHWGQRTAKRHARTESQNRDKSPPEGWWVASTHGVRRTLEAGKPAGLGGAPGRTRLWKETGQAPRSLRRRSKPGRRPPEPHKDHLPSSPRKQSW